MRRIIVERGRRGGDCNKLHRRGNLPLEELSRHESVRAPHNHRKWPREHLGPLRRWLLSQIGRPWDAAYSDVCRVLKPDSVARVRIKTRLLDMVERNTFLRNGKVYCHRGPWSRDDWEVPIETPRYTSALAYVHPETGLLCALPARTRQARMSVTISWPAVPRRWLTDDRVLLQLKGCWFSCEVRPFPPRSQRGERPQRFDLATHRVLSRSQASKIYGERVYCVAKRQLCRKELVEHGLKNDPFGSLVADVVRPVVAGLNPQIPRLSGRHFWWFRPVTTDAERYPAASRSHAGLGVTFGDQVSVSNDALEVKRRGGTTAGQPGGLAARLPCGQNHCLRTNPILMKLHVLSDLHTEFAPFEWPGTRADVVVLAGDTGVGKHGLEWALGAIPSTPVIYVTGNHEYYGQKIPKLVNELRQVAAGSNVQVLENDALAIGDVVFLGATLWTDFALNGDTSLAMADAVTGMSDFRRIRVLPTYRRFHPRDARRFHEASVKWLATVARSFPGKRLVVVTHHAPSRGSLSPRYRADSLNPAYASNLEPLVEELGVHLWIHGHIHHASDYRIGKTRVIANPRGYPDENVSGFNPTLTIEL